MRENLITNLLQRIQKETGIVLNRETDRERIRRFLDNGGKIPSEHEALNPALINLITVNETYFEREPHHFDRLIDEIIPVLENRDLSLPIRILSAPCSSGEETYSIALRLVSRGKKISRPIEIVGVDLSEEMIQKALSGIYSERSVHAVNQEILKRHFLHENNGYMIQPLEGIKFRFLCGNLFNDLLWSELGDFDVIFSRNMMIYFDAEKNRELLLRFKKHLRGYLILGHADDHTNAKEIFTPIRGERGVIYSV